MVCGMDLNESEPLLCIQEAQARMLHFLVFICLVDFTFQFHNPILKFYDQVCRIFPAQHFNH